MTSGHPCYEGRDNRCLSWTSVLETREVRGRHDGVEHPREKSSPVPSLTEAEGLLKVGREGQVTGAENPPSKENPKGFVS